MAPKPPPRHLASTRHRRVVPRHAVPNSAPSLLPSLPGLPNLVPGSKQVGAVASLVVTVAGATVMTGGAYGYGTVVTLPAAKSALAETEVAGAQQIKPKDRLGTSEAASAAGRSLPSGSGDGSTGSTGSTGSGVDSGLGAENAKPASLWIPSISAGSELIELGLDTDKSLETPTDFGVAGWWKGGPRPGDPGPAVIAGHLDSHLGPGVFAKLSLMKPGDEVIVRRNDGKKLTFVVTRIDRYPKRAFPTRNVYNGTDASELRLITCGGTFNRATASYNDNIVVFAKLLIDPITGSGSGGSADSSIGSASKPAFTHPGLNSPLANPRPLYTTRA